MDPLSVLIIFALIATVLALFLGLNTMHGGLLPKELTTKLMWARVGLQGFTALLLLFAVFIS
jgi:hypothetical protein